VCLDLARHSDVLLASEEEAELLLGEPEDEPARLAEALAPLVPGGHVIVKRGARGAVAAWHTLHTPFALSAALGVIAVPLWWLATRRGFPITGPALG
jgi:sugar/nucleoside kinase (ribokinase family)